MEQVTPAAEPSASWASAGGVRQQGRDPREWSLTMKAAERWPRLAAELRAPTLFVQGGHLHIVEREPDLPTLQARVERERAAGMGVRILDRNALRDVAPGITSTAIAGAYTPDDGQANPPATTRAFAAAAQRYGARYLNSVRAERLLTKGGRVVGVQATNDTLSAQWVVLAAGAWSLRLAATVGVDLPLRIRGLQMILTTPGPRVLAPTLSGIERQLSLKQLPGGEFFIGGGWPSDIVQDGQRLHCQVRENSVAGSWAVATDVLPAVGEQRIARSWCGLEAESFDGVPLVGTAPEFDGLLIAAGFSGRGFQLAPAVGRAVADVVSGIPAPELAELAPSRTQSFDATAVAGFKAEPGSGIGLGPLG